MEVVAHVALGTTSGLLRVISRRKTPVPFMAPVVAITAGMKSPSPHGVRTMNPRESHRPTKA